MIGVRELRTDLAARVRRAANGEPTIVTVNGRPAAVLAPLADRAHAPGNDDVSADARRSSLVASGALVPPRRSDGRLPSRTVTVWGNVRLDRLLREVRG